MTRKDYILLVTALRNALATEIDVHGETSESAGGVRLASRRVANALHIDNPRFDVDHFMAVVRGEKPVTSKPSKCKHVPHNPDAMQTVCELCGEELDLR